MDEAKELGVDMFLLDDGWFANKYPRSSDRQGLGDWGETVEKLPNGIGKLVKEATDKGIKFGLWIEPEMVNPKSELYENIKIGSFICQTETNIISDTSLYWILVIRKCRIMYLELSTT